MYLIWSILNSVLFLYFLYLLVGYVSIGRKVLPKNKLRSLAAILLIFGTVGMFRNETQGEDKTNNAFTINELPANISKKDLPHYNVASKHIVLEDNVPFKITTRMRIAFVDGKYIALKSHSGLSGFLSGFHWKQTSSPLVHFDKHGKATYRLDGVLRWNLMGMNVYTESKTFEGTFELDGYKELEEYDAYKRKREQQLVLGKWTKVEDTTIVWEFTAANACKWFTASKLSDSFTYSLSRERMQCGYETSKPKSEDHMYLKLENEDNDAYCYEIHRENDSILSMNYLPTSKVVRFKKLKTHN